VDAKTQRAVPRRAVVVGAALCGLLAVVALATRSGRSSGGDSSTRQLPASFFDYVFTFSIVTGLVMVCALAYYRARRQQQQGKSSWELKQMMMFLVAVAAVSLVAVVWAERLRDGSGSRVQPVQIGTGVAPVSTDSTGRPLPERAPRFRWEALLVAATVAATVAGGFALTRRGRRRPEDRTLREELTAILQDTLDKLWDEQDPRRAVILAYAWMERTLGAHGLPREPSEAPLEYLSRVLLDLDASRESVFELTTLFERARFSPHVIDEEMKADAIAALSALRDELGAEPAGAAG
jgi:hypothetical protein